MVRAKEVQGLTERIEVKSDPRMEARGHTPVDMLVRRRIPGRWRGKSISRRVFPAIP